MAALVFAFGAGLAGLPSAHAQDSPPPPEAPASEEPREITSGDFAIQANAVEDRLSRIRTEMSAIDVAKGVNQALDEIDAEGAELRHQFEALETRRMMISELNALSVQLELQDARTQRQIEKLSVYATDLERLATQNTEDIEIWTRALRTMRGPSVPKAVRDRTASILQGLREGRKELSERINEVLEIQSRALDVRDSVHLAEQAVMLAQREQAKSLFEPQDPPLWNVGARPETEVEREGYDIRFSWPAVTNYLRAERGMSFLQLFLVLALGWLFARTRASLADRIDKRQRDGGIGWEDRAIEALRRPWAAALLLVIASVRFFYPDRVVDMILLTWVVALPLWFVVCKEMVPASFRKALVGLGLLATVHVVVTMVSGHPAVERALLLVELMLVGAGAGWLIRFLLNVDVPKRVRQGLWFSLTSLWARLALLIAVIGVGATVLGYTYLAVETAMVAIIGTIAATVCMALARIVEAIVSSSVYAGRLDAFRMIRANRDVTAKVLNRAVRLAAAALFLWSLADMTTVWRPIGRGLGRALSADLGLGFAKTGVTLGDLGAFFIILWLSWLLARFVSFVLREEIFPRLHMKQGVPFALTTFTRYMIIAVGFIAAVSVIGIPLDRLTIVLSALGVGIGFGLQGLVNNVVSGFVLLTERPIRLRDKIEVEGVLGHVSDIGIRASTIRTFDGAEVIVPNGDLISQRVVNWTLSARRQRVTIPVGVAYGTDPNQVLGILRKVAAADKGVFKDPAPLALFRGFGDSSLDFELRIFMDPSDVLDVPSAVTVAINAALKKAAIEIPFPQRDLHLRGVPGSFSFAGADTDTDTDTDTDADADADADAEK
jgi:small-conductance mechanosensitive channel